MAALSESSPNFEWHGRWQAALWLALLLTLGGFGAVLFGILSDALERQTWREQREATRADLQTLSAERVRLDQAVTELRRMHTALDTCLLYTSRCV